MSLSWPKVSLQFVSLNRTRTCKPSFNAILERDPSLGDLLRSSMPSTNIISASTSIKTHAFRTASSTATTSNTSTSTTTPASEPSTSSASGPSQTHLPCPSSTYCQPLVPQLLLHFPPTTQTNHSHFRSVTFDTVIGFLASSDDQPPDQQENVVQFYWNTQTGSDLAGYELLWRQYGFTQWTHSLDVGMANQVRVNISKDNAIFGLRAYGTNGKKSPAVFPLPVASQYF